jgi:cysteine desulfurase/selenocysteine lyase
MSNVLGTINPTAEIARMAKEYGVTILVDAAQAMAHLPCKLKDFGPIDFLTFSSHKMCGPTGIGVLWGRRELLEKMRPYQYGGDMILQVGDVETTWNELPWKFEAGTPNYGDSIAFGAALDYLQEIGMDKIHAYEQELAQYARRKLAALGDDIKIIGPKEIELQTGVLSFVSKNVHPHDMATFLDVDGIAIRAGHHCAQPLMRSLKVIATNRASFYFYNTKAEVDFFVDSVGRAVEYFS